MLLNNNSAANEHFVIHAAIKLYATSAIQTLP